MSILEAIEDVKDTLETSIPTTANKRDVTASTNEINNEIMAVAENVNTQIARCGTSVLAAVREAKKQILVEVTQGLLHTTLGTPDSLLPTPVATPGTKMSLTSPKLNRSILPIESQTAGLYDSPTQCDSDEDSGHMTGQALTKMSGNRLSVTPKKRSTLFAQMKRKALTPKTLSMGKPSKGTSNFAWMFPPLTSINRDVLKKIQSHKPKQYQPNSSLPEHVNTWCYWWYET